jgi:hypothetical protein
LESTRVEAGGGAADASKVSSEQVVFNRGIQDTRHTLERWNEHPWPVLGEWLAWSLATAAALLASVLAISVTAQPDPTPLVLPGVNAAAGMGDVGHVLIRNGLVLALHSLACVAGFMAGSSLPQLAEHRSGLSRLVHEKAGPLAIGFVVLATGFSLFTQAWTLGHAASTLSSHLGLAPAMLLLGLLPHALPELTALFLPLAAWVIASRRGSWSELLAATVATTSLAVPVLVAASFVEVYVSPRLLLALAG